MSQSDETLEQFKNSFSYGTRTDLNFKFLKKLDDADAGEFFRRLLDEVGASLDDGDLSRIHQLTYEWQVRGYAPEPGAAMTWEYDDGPFAEPSRPLQQSCAGLLTSSGHFHVDDDPEPLGVTGMTQEEAVERIGEFVRTKPDLSVIPTAAPATALRVRHGGYDIRGAAADYNVAFPRDLLLDAAAAGRIGSVAPELYSFVGATSQGRLRKEAIPEWIDRLQSIEIDVLLLVPV